MEKNTLESDGVCYKLVLLEFPVRIENSESYDCDLVIIDAY